MHWNNGRFHGPVTLEKNLNITDFKYNAISYSDNDKIIKYGDSNIGTEINGNNINIISGGTGALQSNDNMMINSGKNITVQSNDGSIDIKSTDKVSINCGGKTLYFKDEIYGTSDPSTLSNPVEGQIYFKIIS